MRISTSVFRVDTGVFHLYNVQALNKDHPLTEREFEIINVIAGGLSSNQRELSARTGISLGLTNLLLRRLVTKGYLKVRQLNAKKVDYLLTPKGFAEKARKSYRYTLKTLSSLVTLKNQIRKLLEAEIAQGQKKFVLVGEGDLVDLIKLAADQVQSSGVHLSRAASLADVQQNGQVVILCGEQPQAKTAGLRTIDLVGELAKLSFPNTSEQTVQSDHAATEKVTV